MASMPRFLRLALVSALLFGLVCTAAAGSAGNFESWTVQSNVSIHATFQSHNTKVLSVGRRGAIISHQTRIGSDGVNGYAVSYLDFGTRETSILLDGESATNAPCLAGGEGNEFAVFINDHHSRKVQFKLMRMAPGNGSARMIAESVIDASQFGKYACSYAKPDFLVMGSDSVLIRIDRDGAVKQRIALFDQIDERGVTLQYPQLLSEDGMLLVGLTTYRKIAERDGGIVYWSIFVLRSPDGGASWYDRWGRRRSLPLLPGDDPSMMITPPNPGKDSNWLAGLDIVQDMIVANHSTNFKTGKLNRRGGFWPIMQYWPLVDKPGRKPRLARLPPQFESVRQTGFFVEDPLRPDDVYFVTFERNTLLVLKSGDKGATWDIAGRFEGAINCPYAIDGTRELTAERQILGVFTERGKGCKTSVDGRVNSAQLVAFALEVGE